MIISSRYTDLALGTLERFVNILHCIFIGGRRIIGPPTLILFYDLYNLENKGSVLTVATMLQAHGLQSSHLSLSWRTEAGNRIL